MLFYIKCPSCSRIISYDMDQYYKEVEEITNNPKISRSEKNERGAKLLEKFGYRSMCCRIRIMGLIPYHKIIVS